MVTLQDWFRTEFTYSTDIPDGHGNSAIESFLEDRVGYCEQFAGTFAAMARSLGIPARVAVGFTQGELQDDGSYLVLGRNAHAWPEVWFDGYGWVPFEPTPGRGMPGAEALHRRPPQQDGEPPPTTSTTTTTTTTTDGSAGTDDDGRRSGAAAAAGDHDDDVAPATSSRRRRRGPRIGRAFPWLLVARRGRRRSPCWSPCPRSSAAGDADAARRSLIRPTPCSSCGTVRCARWRRSGSAAIRHSPRSRSPSARPTPSRRSRDPLRSLAVVATAASYAPTDEVVELADADRQGHGHDGPHGWCALVEEHGGGLARRYASG